MEKGGGSNVMPLKMRDSRIKFSGLLRDYSNFFLKSNDKEK